MLVDIKQRLLVVQLYFIALKEVLRHRDLLAFLVVKEAVSLRRVLCRDAVYLVRFRVVLAEDSFARLLLDGRVELAEEVGLVATLIEPLVQLLEDGLLLDELGARVDVYEDAGAACLCRQLVTGPVFEVSHLRNVLEVVRQEELREAANLIKVLLSEGSLDDRVERLQQA